MEHKLTPEEMGFLAYLDGIIKEASSARQVFLGYLQLKYQQRVEESQSKFEEIESK